MSWIREQQLLEAVGVLWRKVPDGSQPELEVLFHRNDWSWMLDDGPDREWVPTEQVAAEFGLTPQTVRTNWPRRYNIRPLNDRWLRSDVELVRLKRDLKNLGKAA